MSLRLPLGAPGVYRLPDPPLRELIGVRMDVCAFVGVAPRGPAREPFIGGRWYDDRPTVEPGRPSRRSIAVPVESWTDYVRLYGAFEGPGRLPHAVSAFFENGGRRAYVVRIVHEYGNRDENLAARASARLAEVNEGRTEVRLVARNEGAWGNQLRATLTFRTRPLPRIARKADDVPTELRAFAAADLSPGTLVRATRDDGSRTLHWVRDLVDLRYPDDGLQLVSLTPPAVDFRTATIEVVTGELVIDDGDGRVEEHVDLGLSYGHPRWIATVLCRDSRLLLPAPEWSEDQIFPNSPLLAPARSDAFEDGRDRWHEIVPGDAVPESMTTGALDVPGDGVECLEEASEVALLVVPDLYEPAEKPVNVDVVPDVGASGVFEECLPKPPPPVQAVPEVPLDGLTLDPRTQLDEIVDLHRRVIDQAERFGLVALLDVPLGLSDREVLQWRRRLWSSHAAAYHPWVRAARPGDRVRGQRVVNPRGPRFVNPSAVAAGIVARRELAHGISWGPGNELAAGIVAVSDRVDAERHDTLHQSGINVLLRERDGVRLTAARTLSSDQAFRQLSVRRLVSMIERTLRQELDWTVFEPHTEGLRADVRSQLDRFLRRLYRQGAFRGATEDQAFLVRCDEELNPRQLVESGQLVAEIRIAPAEPIEFLVLRIVRGSDGTLNVEGGRG